MLLSHWIRGRLRRRHIYISGAAILIIILSIAFNLLWITPVKSTIANLAVKAQTLKGEKKRLSDQIAREGWHTHGDGHYHTDSAPPEDEAPEDEAGTMARKIMSMEKPLGLKAYQLKLLEEISKMATETGVSAISYKGLMDDAEKVATLQRRPEKELTFNEDIYRYRFRIDYESNYDSIMTFLKEINTMAQPVVVEEIVLRGGNEGKIRVQLDLASYYRQRG